MKRLYLAAIIALSGCERSVAPEPVVDDAWSETNIYYQAWKACDAFAKSGGVINPGIIQGTPEQFGRTRITDPVHMEPEELIVLSYPSRTGRDTWAQVYCETTTDYQVRHYKFDGRVIEQPRY